MSTSPEGSTCFEGAFDNLALDCGPYHDIIDDSNCEADFPVELLRS